MSFGLTSRHRPTLKRERRFTQILPQISAGTALVNNCPICVHLRPLCVHLRFRF